MYIYICYIFIYSLVRCLGIKYLVQSNHEFTVQGYKYTLQSIHNLINPGKYISSLRSHDDVYRLIEGLSCGRRPGWPG
jgi:hypothetical protein